MAKSKKEKDTKESTKAPTFTISGDETNAVRYLGWIKNDKNNRGEDTSKVDKAIKEFASYKE